MFVSLILYWYQNWTKISIKMLFDIVVVNMFLFFLFIIHLLHICNVGLYIENNYPFNKKCIISRFIYLSSAHIAWGDISIVHCTYFLGWHIYRPLRILPVILSFFLSLFSNQSIWNQMYLIHLIILFNILGVMIDNKRFVLYCIVLYTTL